MSDFFLLIVEFLAFLRLSRGVFLNLIQQVGKILCELLHFGLLLLLHIDELLSDLVEYIGFAKLTIELVFYNVAGEYLLNGLLICFLIV